MWKILVQVPQSETMLAVQQHHGEKVGANTNFGLFGQMHTDFNH